METIQLDFDQHGFTGIFYPAAAPSNNAVITMLGDNVEDHLSVCFAKWFSSLGCNALSIGSIQRSGDTIGYHNFALEYLEKATQWLLNNGNDKVGIAGGSTTGAICLAAASHIPDISLVLAYSPCDYIIQGYYEGERDGMEQWPAEGQATVSYHGKALPYQPYYMEAQEFWDTMQNASREHNEMYFLDVMRHSENTAPVPEDAYIKVEKIKGNIVLFAAQDDSLWESEKYCERMVTRLREADFPHSFESHIYRYGTHLIYPEGYARLISPTESRKLFEMFVSGREHPGECEETRIEVDSITREAIEDWRGI